MGSHREITREVALSASGGGSDVLRCWDAPEGMPFKNLGISLSSRGTVLPLGDLDWEVFYGGTWEGTPFAEGSTHSGGESQGVGTPGSIAGPGAAVCVLHNDLGPFPTNRIRKIPNGREYKYEGLGGWPIVVELTNRKASAITIWVTFTSETVSDSQ